MTTSSRADTTRGMEFLYSLRRLKGRAVPTDVRLSPRGVTEAVRARVPRPSTQSRCALARGRDRWSGWGGLLCSCSPGPCPS